MRLSKQSSFIFYILTSFSTIAFADKEYDAKFKSTNVPACLDKNTSATCIALDSYEHTSFKEAFVAFKHSKKKFNKFKLENHLSPELKIDDPMKPYFLYCLNNCIDSKKSAYRKPDSAPGH